jgi:hypothetical protein
LLFSQTSDSLTGGAPITFEIGQVLVEKSLQNRVEISLAITVTMKDIDPDFKARLLIECAKLLNTTTNCLQNKME